MFGTFGFCFGDVAVFYHGGECQRLAIFGGGKVNVRGVDARCGDDACEHSRLAKRQTRRRAAEVTVRCLVDAVVAAAEVDIVEIDLEDLGFFVAKLHVECEKELFCLACHRLVGAEEEVFDGLLRDGAGAFLYLAVLQIDERRAHHAFDVEAVVIVEALVFRGDDGILELAGDVFKLGIAEMCRAAGDGIFEREEAIDARPSIRVQLGQVVGREGKCAHLSRCAVGVGHESAEERTSVHEEEASDEEDAEQYDKCNDTLYHKKHGRFSCLLRILSLYCNGKSSV